MNKSRLSMTLMLYLMRHTGLRILAATGAVVMLVAIIDTSELFRRVSNKESVTSFSVLMMEAVKIPSTLPLLIPFGVLIGLIISFQKLRSTNEIVIARTNGLSLLKIATGPIILVSLLSLLALIIIDPIASATRKRYEALEENLFGGNGRNLTVSTEGIWFRDRNENIGMIIHGDEIDTQSLALINPLVYTFDQDNKLIARYYPESLALDEGYWRITGGDVIDQTGKATAVDETIIKSSLSQRDLTHSNKRPETIPLFELWGYIDVLNKAGLPSLAHSSYLYYQLSTPFLLIGIVLIVARFTLNLTSRKGWGHMFIFTVTFCLGLYFIKDLLYVMGSSGRIHPFIAGFSPSFLMIIIGTGLLMRAEER